jgi:quercetin dioxygenase-like cupin family protein
MTTEHEEGIGPVASKLVFENHDVKIWETDVAPGETFPLHHHTYDYVLFTTGAALLEVRDYGRQPTTAPVPAHSAIFIPAGGIESFANIGQTRFTEVLIEVKRPRRADQERVDFTISNTLAGREPLPGVVHLLENSRVRIIETTLAPGESTGMNRQDQDGAVFVLSGSKVKVTEQDEKGKRFIEENRPANSASWMTGGVGREIVNLGSSPYREINVQVK